MLKNAAAVALGVGFGWPLAQLITQFVLIPIVTKLF